MGQQDHGEGIFNNWTFITKKQLAQLLSLTHQNNRFVHAKKNHWLL